MSVIAEARALATEVVEIESHLIVTDKDAAALEFASDCKLGLTLAHLIVEGYVTRVDSKALALLDNAVARGRQITARKDAAVLAATENYGGGSEEQGPIFPVGSMVTVRHTDWVDTYPSDTVQVWGARWDAQDEVWVYHFGNSDVAYTVQEGDLRWDVQPVA